MSNFAPYMGHVGKILLLMSILRNRLTSNQVHQLKICNNVSSGIDQRKHQSSSSPRLLCAVNSPVTGEFPAQMASNAENVSIWWRHHASTPLLYHKKVLVSIERCPRVFSSQPFHYNHDPPLWSIHRGNKFHSTMISIRCPTTHQAWLLPVTHEWFGHNMNQSGLLSKTNIKAVAQ